MLRFANVSIDLDGLGCYHSIHRLDAAADPTVMYTVALPRFFELFDRTSVRATLFVIASDLRHEEVVSALREAVARGHEVASHTFGHPYDLRRWNETRIAREIERASDMIRDTVGVRPVGFRTPGYNVDTRIVRILSEQGYRYDSSVFPCPPYYAAKGAVMAAMAVAGRPSGSDMTHPAALSAPLQPYRPSRFNFARRGDRKHSLPIWEFPIGVLRGARVPVIGTTVGALGPRGARAFAKAFRVGQRALQFELHGIDMLDAHDAAIAPELAARQPDVRRSWNAKGAAYEAFISELGTTHPWMTLADAARELDRAAGPTVVGDRMGDFG